MEWVKPIDQVERDIRAKGVFMLVDIVERKLWFYGFKKNQSELNRTMDALKGRSTEMIKHLIALARAQGETK